MDELKNRIPQKRLKYLLRYDRRTGYFFWRQGRVWTHAEGSKAGSLMKIGYVAIGIDGQRYFAHRLAIFYVTGRWPSHQVDHRNGNRADNRWDNLRVATRANNSQNQRLSKASTSGFKGVTWHRKNRKWMAYIKYNKRLYNLGSFFRIEDAAKAYDRAAIKQFGEFASTNEALGLL